MDDDRIVGNALAALAGRTLEEAIIDQCLRWEDFAGQPPLGHVILFDLPLNKKTEIEEFVKNIESILSRLDNDLKISSYYSDSIVDDTKFCVLIRVSGITEVLWKRASASLVPFIQHTLYE